jgi:glycosyltransferase involved in cell wall biosynthesis
MNEPLRPVLGMILKGYPRISETFISNEILLLEQLGFQIHLFSMRQPRESFVHGSVQKIKAPVDYLPETLWRPLPKLLAYNLRLACKRPRRYARALKKAWRRFRRTHKTATLKHLLQAGYLVQRFLPGTHVGHLHAHFAHSPTSVALFASQLSGLPFSFTAHAKDIYTSHRRQLAEKISLARFVVTCTGYNQQYLKQLNGNRTTPVYRVYHGIDTRLFNHHCPRSKPHPPYQILTVARLTAKKGLPTVLKALQSIHRQGIAVKHTLIGDGEERENILALVKRYGLDSVTRWLGTQPHEVVIEHYRRADLFVVGCEVAPNGDRDGIPNVLLESMAMGVPVVATRVSAIPELVAHHKSGLLVPPRRPHLLAQAIQELLTNESLRQKVIQAGQETVAQAFDNRQLIKDLASILRENLTHSAPPMRAE